MSVLLVTSAGEIVIDLFTDECPLACENFLKLCKFKYYHQQLIYSVRSNYLLQLGDPTGTGKGGHSWKEIMNSVQKKGSNQKQMVNEDRYVHDEINENRKLNRIGYVGMARYGKEPNRNLSQIFITLRAEDMEHIAKNHTIFGEVAEGFDVLEKLNNLYCDEEFRPYQDVRIKHTYILDDPFPDPNGIEFPSKSPERIKPPEEKIKSRIPYEENLEISKDDRTEEEIDAEIKRKEAKSRAIVLEMTGDIPDADVKPPEEVLFICKLNAVTTDEDLELIFSRFGRIKSCEIIRDYKTGDSLNYAFIEYESYQSCVEAYEKMNNVLIDDRRIKVDFSQSVSKLWNRFLLAPRREKSKDNLKNLPAVLKPSSNQSVSLDKKESGYKRKVEGNDIDQNKYRDYNNGRDGSDDVKNRTSKREGHDRQLNNYRKDGDPRDRNNIPRERSDGSRHDRNHQERGYREDRKRR